MNRYFEDISNDNENKNGATRPVTNFIVEFAAVEKHSDGRSLYDCRLLLEGEGQPRTLTLTPKHFADPRLFNESVTETSDARARFLRDKSVAKVLDTIKATEATTAKHIRVEDRFGWDANQEYFCSPSLALDRKGSTLTPDELLERGIRCDAGKVGNQARYLDLKRLDGKQFDRVLKHIVEDHPNYVGYDRAAVGLAHAFLAGIQIDWQDEFNPFTLQFAGTSGLGKTEYAQSLQCFYGDFAGRRTDCIMSWTSTPNSVQETGALFKDALYLVDDLKEENLAKDGLRQAKRVIQGYADRRGRGRSGFGGSKNDVPPIGGMLLITGEDIVERSASTLARVLVVDFNELLQTEERTKARLRIKEFRRDYSGVTTEFVGWYCKTKQRGNLRSYLENYRNELEEKIHSDVRQNRNRIVQNLALSMAGFAIFRDFACEQNALTAEKAKTWMEKYFDYLVRLATEAHTSIQDQRQSAIFIQYFRSLLEDTDPLDLGRLETNGIVERDEQYLWVDFGKALIDVRKEIGRTREPVYLSEKRLKDELLEDGYVIPELEQNRKPRFETQKRVQGKRRRLARFVREKLEGEESDEAPANSTPD